MATSFRYMMGKVDSDPKSYGRTNDFGAATRMCAYMSIAQQQAVWEVRENGISLYQAQNGKIIKENRND